jgi:hypothetical protein
MNISSSGENMILWNKDKITILSECQQLKQEYEELESLKKEFEGFRIRLLFIRSCLFCSFVHLFYTYLNFSAFFLDCIARLS